METVLSHPALPQGLQAIATTDPNSPWLDAFFAAYDQAFVLPEEKETREGFRRCLALHHPPAYPQLAAQYGEFRDILLCVLPEGEGSSGAALAGGASFFVRAGTAARPTPTIHLSYVFVTPMFQRRGILDALLATLTPAAEAFLEIRGAPWIFLEQNDPLRMTADAYDRDGAHSGVDQIARIGLWARRGARIVDIDYVQPALSAGQEAADALVLSVIPSTPASSTLEAAVLRDHLEAFFAISVLKGQDPRGAMGAGALLAGLDRRASAGEAIALWDPRPWLSEAVRGPQPGGLRGVLRERGSAG